MGVRAYGKTDQNSGALVLTGGATANGATLALLDWDDAGTSEITHGTVVSPSASVKDIEVTEEGYYLVLFRGYFSTMTSAKVLTVHLYKNGVAMSPVVKTIYTALTGRLDVSMGLHHFGWCAPGDRFSIYCGVTSGGNVTPVEASLTVIKIG